LARRAAPARRTPCPSRPATSARNSPTAAGSWFSWATLLTASSTASQFGPAPNEVRLQHQPGDLHPAVARRVLQAHQRAVFLQTAGVRSTQGKQRAHTPSRAGTDVGLRPSARPKASSWAPGSCRLARQAPSRGRSAWRSEGRSRTPAARFPARAPLVPAPPGSSSTALPGTSRCLDAVSLAQAGQRLPRRVELVVVDQQVDQRPRQLEMMFFGKRLEGVAEHGDGLGAMAVSDLERGPATGATGRPGAPPLTRSPATHGPSSGRRLPGRGRPPRPRRPDPPGPVLFAWSINFSASASGAPPNVNPI